MTASAVNGLLAEASTKGRLRRDGASGLVRLAIAAQVHDLVAVDQRQGQTRYPMPLHLVAHEGVDVRNIRRAGT
jgi:hypothetical protein